MKNPLLAVVATAGMLIGLPENATAALHSNKVIGLVLQASGDTCFYFQLDGVTSADPTVSTSPLFAISRSDPAAKDMFALLMTAKATDRTITVDTNGQGICGGFARANGIWWY